jgi:hypothetical protein
MVDSNDAFLIELEKKDLDCFYIISEQTCKNLITLLKLNDDNISTIPSKFNIYIKKLMLLVNSEPKSLILKIKPYTPKKWYIINRRKEFSFLSDSVSDNEKSSSSDPDSNSEKSFFGDLSFGETKDNTDQQNTTFTAKTAIKQLLNNRPKIRLSTQIKDNMCIVVIIIDNSGNITLSFFNIPSDADKKQVITPVTVTPVTGTPVTVTPVTGTPVTVTPVTGTPVTVTPVTVSPIQWIKSIDTETEKTYYYNEQNNTTYWEEYNSDEGQIYYFNPQTGSFQWEKPENYKKKYYHKYLKYKQKYLEIQKYGKELEGGWFGDRTYIFCPNDVKSVVEIIYKNNSIFKTKDKEFFLFLTGPRSYYTEGKTKKISSLWYDFVDNTFWSDSLNLQKAKTLIENKIKEKNIQKIKGKNDKEYDVLINNYDFFSFKSVNGGFKIDYKNLVK